jgi:hypothetical protein
MLAGALLSSLRPERRRVALELKARMSSIEKGAKKITFILIEFFVAIWLLVAV